MMLRFPILAFATLLVSADAFADTKGQLSSPGRPSAGTVPSPHPAAKAPGSTAESRSAEALALTPEPFFDEGTVPRLRAAALSYADIAVRGGWPEIPADARFAAGAAGPHDELLRRRLIMSGDLAGDRDKGAYDETLAEAVRRFQVRHGLAATGSMTPRTIAAMNVSVRQRIKQLEASIERLENTKFPFGSRYVVVNIPAAFAEAVENDVVVRRYRVVVGKTDKPSPTLTTEITSVVLNPTWTVPPSIAKTEISAHMRKDPGYLSRMHMDVLDAHDRPIDPRSVDWSGNRTPNFTVRQKSGTFNALGAVKIDMPNPYSVYMHDTQKRNLFNEDYRFDSHGCSRVDNVRDLAAWLLKDQPQWSRAAIDAKIAGGAREEIHLVKKVPVAWVYLTGWMNKDETVHFRNDVYHRDDQLPEATAEEMAFLNKGADHPLTAHLVD